MVQDIYHRPLMLEIESSRVCLSIDVDSFTPPLRKISVRRNTMLSSNSGIRQSLQDSSFSSLPDVDEAHAHKSRCPVDITPNPDAKRKEMENIQRQQNLRIKLIKKKEEGERKKNNSTMPCRRKEISTDCHFFTCLRQPHIFTCS